MITDRITGREVRPSPPLQPSIVWRGDLADVITRGDANEVGEEWSVPAEGTVGLVVLRAPAAGYVLAGLGTTVGQLVLGAVALGLAGWALELIWRRPEPARVPEGAGRAR